MNRPAQKRTVWLRGVVDGVLPAHQADQQEDPRHAPKKGARGPRQDDSTETVDRLEERGANGEVSHSNSLACIGTVVVKL